MVEKIGEMVKEAEEAVTELAESKNAGGKEE
jgi:hypothetical protein